MNASKALFISRASARVLYSSLLSATLKGEGRIKSAANYTIALASISKSKVNSLIAGSFKTPLKGALKSISTIPGLCTSYLEMKASIIASKTRSVAYGMFATPLSGSTQAVSKSASTTRGKVSLAAKAAARAVLKPALIPYWLLKTKVFSASSTRGVYGKFAMLRSKIRSKTSNTGGTTSGVTSLAGKISSLATVVFGATFGLIQYSVDPRYEVWLTKRRRDAVLGPKDPSETVIVTFFFTHTLAIGEFITDVLEVTAETYAGTDDSPESMISGISIVNTPTSIQQQVTGGVDGCIYKIKMTAQTNMYQTLSGTATILVVSQ
jgi:hypothetical protein